MIKRLIQILALFSMALTVSPAWADDYQNTINVFRKAVESGSFFKSAYGYAVFPTIGKAGVGVGGAFGKGRVYEKGKYIGDTSMTQVTVGFQLGGQAYSQIVFFQDQRSLKEFTSGQLRVRRGGFGGGDYRRCRREGEHAGSSAAPSEGQHDAKVVGAYTRGWRRLRWPKRAG